MDKREVIKIIKKFVKALRRHGISVDQVIWYGSYARGKVRPDSDMDVALISRNFVRAREEEECPFLE